MIGRFLLCLSAIICSAFTICENATAATATKDVGVVVTHNAGTAPGSVVATHDFYEPSLSSAPPGNAVPYTFGQAFRVGDVPSGTHVSVTDANGSALPYQIDSVSPAWPDGSTRHEVFTVLVPATSGNIAQRLKLVLQSGAYSPASTPRSISDITAHNYLIHYRNVLTHPGNNLGKYSWATYGSHSGNFTCAINSFISAGQYKIRANGPAKLTAYVYGFATDDAGTGSPDSHIYCEDWIDVYTNPANSAQVYFVEQMPLISQPVANPNDGAAPGNVDPNADYVIGQASLYDGSTKLRDYADDALNMGGSGTNPGNANVSNNSFTPPSNFPGMTTRAAYRVHLVSGSLPGGLAEGNITFMEAFNYGANFHLDHAVNNDYGCGNGGPDCYTISSADNTSRWQLIPLQGMAYYNGFFITADILGAPIRQVNASVTASAPPMVWPDLDGTTKDNSTASQKAYWQSTGLVPGWDLTFNSTVTPMDASAGWSWTDESPYYRAGANGPYRTGIDGGGVSYDTDGPWPEWIARSWVRQGATNWTPGDWSTTWVAGLYTANLPQTLMARQPVGSAPPYIIPWNDGPNKAGGSYPSLGSPGPTDFWYADNGSSAAFVLANLVGPPNKDTPPKWPYGPWGSHFTDYHWPPSCIMEYMVFGKDYFLKLLRGSAQRVALQEDPSVGAHTLNFNGTNYYRIPALSSAHGEIIVLRYAAALLGPASDPENAYFTDMMNDENTAFRLVYNSFGSAKQAGGLNMSGPNADSFNSNYLTLGYMWAFGASRNPGPAYIAKGRITLTSGLYDAPGANPATATGTGTWGISVQKAATTCYYCADGGWSWPFNTGSTPPDPRANLGNAELGTGQTAGAIGIGTNGVLSFSPSSVPGDWGWMGLADGDILRVVNLGGGSCDGPPELCPPNFPELQPFYLINTNNTAGTANITSVKGDASHIIGRISAGPWNTPNVAGWWNLTAKKDNGGIVCDYALSYCLLPKASLAEAIRMGVVPDPTYGVNRDQAYAVLNARIGANSATWSCYQNAQNSMTKICESTAVPVVPALKGP